MLPATENFPTNSTITQNVTRLSALLTALAGTGLAYQQFATTRDKVNYPALGQLIDVEGRQQHLYGLGQGSPTVIVDTGLGSLTIDWQLVQPEVAKFTRIFTYDRAGYGWSDPSSRPRTSQEMVTEMRQLIQKAELEGPFILVGHSLGGMNMRLYAHHYPQDVAGLILVDSAHEEMTTRLPPHLQNLLAMTWLLKAPGSAAARLGLVRLGLMAVQPPEFVQQIVEKFPPDIQPLLKIPRYWPHYAETLLNELANFETSAAQVREVRPAMVDTLKHMPMVVISASPDHSAARFRRVVNFSVERFKEQWLTLQTDLTQLSSHSDLWIADKSGHSIMVEQPELIVQAIRRMVEVGRGK